jgi:hypothetical protein
MVLKKKIYVKILKFKLDKKYNMIFNIYNKPSKLKIGGYMSLLKRTIFAALIFISIFISNCASVNTDTDTSNRISYEFEHNEGNGYFKYYDTEGKLAWKTFYARWHEVPDSYFIYLSFDDNLLSEAKPALWKIVGGFEGALDEVRKNDINFSYENGKKRLNIKFSPWNYTNAKDSNMIPLGSKKYNYKEAIERWNFMLNNYF